MYPIVRGPFVHRAFDFRSLGVTLSSKSDAAERAAITPIDANLWMYQRKPYLLLLLGGTDLAQKVTPRGVPRFLRVSD